MENEHTINALIRKRAEIAGKIENLQGQLKAATVELDHVEATLRIFAPTIDIVTLGPRKVPPAHHAYHGEVTRIVLEALRTAAAPLATTELARRVMVERGLDTTDTALSRTMAKRIGACLRHWQQKGTIRSMAGPGQVYLWEVIR